MDRHGRCKCATQLRYNCLGVEIGQQIHRVVWFLHFCQECGRRLHLGTLPLRFKDTGHLIRLSSGVLITISFHISSHCP